MSVGRRVFHCVVDDTALTVNISEIKKWTAQGAITLIVPLYTLERLRALKKAGSQLGVNAREAVRFLDRVTSGKHNIPASKVVLQGPMEQFETWEEAERYFLPEFKEEALSEPVHEEPVDTQLEEDIPINEPQKPSEDLNEMSQMLLSKLNFKKEADVTSVNSGGTRSFPTSPLSGSSRASPEFSISQLGNPTVEKTDCSTETGGDEKARFVIPEIPAALQPLLNAVLWRLHAQPDASAVPSSSILVTNDRNTQAWAQKFGITAKTVPQLRTSIIYEEKEFKNHCKYLEKNQSAPEPSSLLSFEEESDEDVVLFVPRGRGNSRTEATPPRLVNGQNSSTKRVVSGQPNGTVKAKDIVATDGSSSAEVPAVPIDPDSFSRNIVTPKHQQKLVDTTTLSLERTVTNGPIPRTGGGRRASSRGGTFRGSVNGRGRGKLWVP